MLSNPEKLTLLLARIDTLNSPEQLTVNDWQKLLDQVAKLAEQWKEAAAQSGICMTCALGRTDNNCTDCMNTGWANGQDPHELLEIEKTKVKVLEAELELCPF